MISCYKLVIAQQDLALKVATSISMPAIPQKTATAVLVMLRYEVATAEQAQTVLMVLTVWMV
jgi:hypothetical protein